MKPRFWLERWQKDQVGEQTKERLHYFATLVRSDVTAMLTNGPSKDQQAHIRDSGQVINTLIATNGSVLTDSNPRTVSDVVRMENHKDGPGPAGLVRTDVPMTAVPDKVVRRLPGTLAR